MTSKNSIMAEMEVVQDDLRKSLHRVEIIERKLKTKLLTIEKRERLETELEEVKEVLKTNEDKLQSLRKSNVKTFITAACIVIVYFVITGYYQLSDKTTAREISL